MKVEVMTGKRVYVSCPGCKAQIMVQDPKIVEGEMPDIPQEGQRIEFQRVAGFDPEQAAKEAGEPVGAQNWRPMTPAEQAVEALAAARLEPGYRPDTFGLRGGVAGFDPEQYHRTGVEALHRGLEERVGRIQKPGQVAERPSLNDLLEESWKILGEIVQLGDVIQERLEGPSTSKDHPAVPVPSAAALGTAASILRELRHHLAVLQSIGRAIS